MMSIFQCGLNHNTASDDESSTVRSRICSPRNYEDAVAVDTVAVDTSDPIMNTRSASRLMASGDDDGSETAPIPENITPPWDEGAQQQQQQLFIQPSQESPRTLEEFPHGSDMEQRMKELLVSTSSEGDPTAAADAALAIMYSDNDSLQVSAETSSVRFLDPEVADTMDLDYVEEYDNAFNEFLTTQPQFLIENPDLVHSIRIIKLQKHLTVQANQESQLLDEWEVLQHQKSDMEAGWHDQLRTAARKKAARETHLESFLSGIGLNTKCMEAQLTWHMITDVQKRSQHQDHLRQELQREAEEIDVFSDQQQQNHYDDNDDSFSSRQKPWLHQLPEGPEFDSIRDAMLAPPSGNLSDEQLKDVAQFQMDNAFLQRELSVLRKRVAHQAATSQNYAWVESILQTMDESSLRRLKRRFQKRAGVPL
mmetsp:Transcript_8908/g.14843  ORF Transcript_8908/g.14843 Transcript_8908/m.14843 type:complete len:423 (+) Transcript_8908:138-1406(+)|eukprot:CAMPEP_0119017132 /NCGR_PEP_ID=MMETSP1176-20130426/15500_1 /TAXON_ID=265551 /ORGANISM="Synedropsis recta cf, Strain CCMP1620" /LENGTH=422 /DNA_ID=CAMNT_0006970757 /DNA_START=10 /DNA_END=1278 /DNA_ORIENTATION=-